MNLERVVDDSIALGREDFEHRGFEHVILEAAVDERRRHLGHRFHRVDVGGDAGDLLLHQIEVA